MHNAEVIIIGGGIVGLCSALALQRQGMSALVVDPDLLDRPASWGNAGHIAIEQAEPIASLATIRSALGRLTIFGGPLGLPARQIRHWGPFALRLAQASHPRRFEDGRRALSSLLFEAMPAWRRLAGILPQPGTIREDGHMIVWFGPDAARRGLQAWQGADTGTARFRFSTAEEIATVVRATGRTPAGAITFSNTGQVADPGATLNTLRRAFTAAGGLVCTGRVVRLATVGDEFAAGLDDGTTLTAPRILVASGVWSGKLLADFGLKVPIIAERGYHIQASAHRWPEGLPPVVFEEQSTIVTRFSSGLRIASFVEFGSVDAPPNARRWSTLEQRARSLNLPIEGPVSRWSGARPTLPDYLPAIGRSAGLPNLFYAFGHQHLGLTLGPITGEIVARMVLGEGQSLDLKPFDIARYETV